MPEQKKSKTTKASKQKPAKGDSLVCEVCGFSLLVDEECGCSEYHEIMCCGKPMTKKEPKVKAAK